MEEPLNAENQIFRPKWFLNELYLLSRQHVISFVWRLARYEDYRRRWPLFLYPARQRNAVDFRHPHVGYHKVKLRHPQKVQRLRPVRCLCDLVVHASQILRECLSQSSLIVHK